MIINRNDGRIRISEDACPLAHEFLEENYNEDHAHLNDSDDKPHVRKPEGGAGVERAERLGGGDN